MWGQPTLQHCNTMQQPTLMHTNTMQQPMMQPPMQPPMQQPTLMHTNTMQQPMMQPPMQQPMQPPMQQPTLMHTNTMQPPMQAMRNPTFNLLAKGSGIDPSEYDAITKSAMRAYNQRMTPLSKGVIQGIKQMLGGEWFVLASPVGMTNYDFCLSVVTGNDFLSFTVENMHFQICRLRENK